MAKYQMKKNMVSAPLRQRQEKRVDSVIEQVLHQKVVVIPASAGAGKVYTSSLYPTPLPGAYPVWVRLTAADTSTARFWEAFTQGISSWNPELAVVLEKIPAGSLDSPATLNSVLCLLREAAQAVDSLILLFDGFDLLDDGPVKRLILSIVERTSDQISYLLIGGEKMAVSLSNSVLPAYITNQHLSFSMREIQTYYAALRIKLTQRQLEQVFRLTGGWAAAVQLLGLCLKKNDPLSDLSIQSAVSVVYTIFDQEVFTGLPEYVFHSLILLSLLDEFTPELLTTISGLERQELRQLAQSNPFVHYNAVNGTYHLEDLCRAYWASKLIQIPIEEQHAFLSAAGAWYEKTDSILETVRYYIQAKDYHRLQAYLVTVDILGLSQELCAAVEDQLYRIPHNHLYDRPTLWLARILTRLRGDHVRKAWQEIKQLEATLNASDPMRQGESRQVLGEIYLLYFMQSMRQGKRDSLEYLRKAAELLPNGSKIWTGDANNFVGNASCLPLGHEADMTELVQLYQQAAPYLAIALKSYGSGVEHLAACEAHYYRSESSEALQCAGWAIQKAVAHEQWDIAGNACLLVVLIGLAAGDLHSVEYYRDLCHKYAGLDRRNHHRVLIDDIADWSLYHALGQYDRCAEWIKSPVDCVVISHYWNAGRELFPMAAHLVATGHYYQALGIINTGMEVCARNGKWITKLDLQIMKAVVYLLLEQEEIALAEFSIAYRMAEQDRIEMPFVKYGSYLRNLIRLTRAYPGYGEIPEDWLERMDRMAAEYKNNIRKLKQEYLSVFRQSSLVSLSEREMQAFSLLCSNMKVEEMAEAMSISVSTVKSTLSHIYRKLGVNNKADAVKIGLSGVPEAVL